YGQPLVAPDANDLLDQVFLDLQVEAVGRRLHEEDAAVALGRQSQPLEDRGDLVVADVDPDHLARAIAAQAHGLAHRQPGDDVVDRSRASAADVDDEPRDVFDVLDGGGGVDAALEA